eukprot:scaffold30562_cov107-Isochrysis_galbana.AAC.3
MVTCNRAGQRLTTPTQLHAWTTPPRGAAASLTPRRPPPPSSQSLPVASPGALPRRSPAAAKGGPRPRRASVRRADGAPGRRTAIAAVRHIYGCRPIAASERRRPRAERVPAAAAAPRWPLGPPGARWAAPATAPWAAAQAPTCVAQTVAGAAGRCVKSWSVRVPDTAPALRSGGLPSPMLDSCQARGGSGRARRRSAHAPAAHGRRGHVAPHHQPREPPPRLVRRAQRTVWAGLRFGDAPRHPPRAHPPHGGRASGARAKAETSRAAMVGMPPPDPPAAGAVPSPEAFRPSPPATPRLHPLAPRLPPARDPDPPVATWERFPATVEAGVNTLGAKSSAATFGEGGARRLPKPRRAPLSSCPTPPSPIHPCPIGFRTGTLLSPAGSPGAIRCGRCSPRFPPSVSTAMLHTRSAAPTSEAARARTMPRSVARTSRDRTAAAARCSAPARAACESAIASASATASRASSAPAVAAAVAPVAAGLSGADLAAASDAVCGTAIGSGG